MKSLSSSETITPLIYRALVREHLTRIEELRNPRVVYVTELVTCSHKHRLRQVYPEIAISFEPSLVVGQLLHIGVEKYLASSGFLVEYPVEGKFEVEGVEYALRGRVDAYHPDEGLVVEVKSLRSDKGGPLEHHVQQVQVYLNMLNVDAGVLLYIAPTSFREYRVEREAIDLKSLIKLVVEDRQHPKWSWECKYCAFRKLCSYRVVGGES